MSLLLAAAESAASLGAAGGAVAAAAVEALPLGSSHADPQVSLTPLTRIIAAIIAIAFTVFVLELIRRHRLQERYSVIWFAAGLAMLVGAAFPGLLEVVAGAMGVRDTNVALFSLILLLLLGLALNFSVIVSRQSEQITRLAQELAIRDARDGDPPQELSGRTGDEGPSAGTPGQAPRRH